MGTYTRWRAPFGGGSTPICASTYERTCTWTVSFSVNSFPNPRFSFPDQIWQMH